MKLSSLNEKLGLKTLVALHQARWMDFSKRLDAYASEIGFDNKNEKLSNFEVVAEDFVKAGFSEDEAAALLFIVADGADNLDEIDQWIARNKKAVAYLT